MRFDWPIAQLTNIATELEDSIARNHDMMRAIASDPAAHYNRRDLWFDGRAQGQHDALERIQALINDLRMLND